MYPCELLSELKQICVSSKTLSCVPVEVNLPVHVFAAEKDSSMVFDIPQLYVSFS